MAQSRHSTVGCTFCLLFILYLAPEVKAVTGENLEDFQKFGDEISNRVLDDKSIEINWNRSEGDDKETKSTEPRLFKSSSEEPLGMDSLTIIWYLTTFAILFGFFVVMACTEKACNRSRSKPPETRTCPPTPCPSYKNFAPPGYDTVMKKYKAQRVFIVPVHEDNNFFSANLTDATLPTYEATTTVVDVEKCAEMDR